ncbi:hypothetical protein, partial [Pseudovibrio sp. WM33]|uniref:hypothetical protein n=1 Tax=Pseudovibrio sp. WM33 TaxID=1735585 RepID=UPI0019D395B1
MTVAVLWGSTSSGSASCRHAGWSDAEIRYSVLYVTRWEAGSRIALRLHGMTTWGNRLRLTKLIPLTQKQPYSVSRAHAFGQEWTVHSAAWVG